MAERVGFEPTIRLLVYTLSKRAPGTWRHAQLYFLNRILQQLGVRLNMFVTNVSPAFGLNLGLNLNHNWQCAAYSCEVATQILTGFAPLQESCKRSLRLRRFCLGVSDLLQINSVPRVQLK